jgi:hypothetical protein
MPWRCGLGPVLSSILAVFSAQKLLDMRLHMIVSLSVAVLVGADTKAVPFGSPGHVHTILSPAGGYMKLSPKSNTSFVPGPDHRGHTLAIEHAPEITRGYLSHDGDGYALGDEQHSKDDDEDTEDTIADIKLANTPDSRSPNAIFGAVKRQATTAPRNCGTWIMDCYKARGACNNACYYQNCVNGGRPITYTDYGGVTAFPDIAEDNRKLAGTTVSNSVPPCRMLPLSQRFWDTWPGWARTDPSLDTDEYVRSVHGHKALPMV